jgi:hypothetical protein
VFLGSDFTIGRKKINLTATNITGQYSTQRNTTEPEHAIPYRISINYLNFRTEPYSALTNPTLRYRTRPDYTTTIFLSSDSEESEAVEKSDFTIGREENFENRTEPHNA